MHNQLPRFFYICILLVWVCFFAPICQAATCQTAQASRTFFQPWQVHATYSTAQWDALFAGLRQHGFNEVIVQWSSYGPVSFMPDSRPGREAAVCLPALIKAAQRAQCTLWIGLHYAPDFWERIGSKEAIAPYLAARLQSFEQTLPLLLDLIRTADPGRETVVGWYIADEIDDSNWQGAEQQTALINYLAAVSNRLHAATPSMPVLVSGFVNGAMTPAGWSDLVRRILAGSTIRTFLLQDGIGAGKMTIPRLQPYLQSLKQTLPDPSTRLSIIVELFSMMNEGEDVTRSAPFDRIVQQLRLAASYCSSALTVFSAPDHLVDAKRPGAAALSARWRQDQTGCPGNG